MKTVNKFLSLILAVAMLLSVCSFSVAADETAAVQLTDIDSSTTVGKAVTKLVSMGIINGYPDGTFKADNAITRAEFSVVMVKFLGMQDFINPDAVTGFEDLDLDENYAWARPYVAMAVQRGIINGFEDKTFRAADPVTYEQAVKMIVCALGYGEKGAMPTIEGDWSSGYIALAMRLRVTNGTSSAFATKTQPTTRGIVAILTSNALEVEVNDTVTDSGDVIMGGDNTFEGLDYKEISGIVTGTYITELESEASDVPKDHIMIEDEIYEIGFSSSPYAFLGCKVNAIAYNEEDSDYPVIKSIELDKRTEIISVQAGDFEYNEEGIIEYIDRKKSNKWKEYEIEEDYIVIFNEKLDEDYNIEDLEEDLVTGYVEFIDNDGDNKAEIVRVNSYEVHVVYSKSTSSEKITFMYEDEDGFTFPQESTAILFSLKRNGKDIKFSEISKMDVLNIKASDDDAKGKRFYEVTVTKDTISGKVTERDADAEDFVSINDDEYRISPFYQKFIDEAHEDAVELTVGESAQVYLDLFGNIVAVAKPTSTNSSETYAYLWGVRQENEDSQYDLEFWLYTADGKELRIGAASKITLDGKKYKSEDNDIMEILTAASEKANEHYFATYEDVVDGSIYNQPIIYQTNSEGLISVMHTVLSEENEKISMVMNSEDEDGDQYFVPYKPGEINDETGEYEGRAYKSSSKSFTDFKVSSSTKIIFVPDDRNLRNEYDKFSYSKAFANGRAYHVEAFGCTSSGTASLVLLYKQNDSRIYTSSSPWMIVASKSNTKDGAIIKGYQGTSYSLRSVTVSEEDGPSISDIGKGDIIRYIVNIDGELVDYQIWFDASNPSQLEPVSTNKDLYVDEEKDTTGANRIVEIHSTSTTPRDNYPTATFRLHFGTVTELILKDENSDSVDEESITISPVLVEDELEMDYFDKENPKNNCTISKAISSSLKVFRYDRNGRNSDVETEVDLSEILDYANYGEDATRVIAYTAGGTLRMIYIINE